MSSYKGIGSVDPNSFAIPEECIVTDLHLDIQLDFGRKVVHGTGTYTCKKISTSADFLILDTDSLKIQKVYCKQTSQVLQYTVGDPVGLLGSKLQITLLSSFSNEFEICIDFENSPTAAGLQWMEADQTLGKTQPYLYSQFQTVFARTVLPCQDTPAVKHPYSARVTVNKELTVLMSAIRDAKEDAPLGKVTYVFSQKVPMPCYLIAIAAGALASKEILGEEGVTVKTTVWTEPQMIEDAAWEFEHTYKMIKIAEKLCGAYVWGHYDILVLPPTFPYGGMENPCLTFCTPALVVGDRSLTSVIAHEISHSWTGNLVTNVNWEHFWLNEGHTMFLERKIIGEMQGEQERQFGMESGWTTLQRTIEDLKPTNPLTSLVVDLTDTFPEDSFSKVPYEKGSALLYTIESKLGGAAVINPWLKAYIQHFANKSINTDEWKEFLYSYFDTDEQQAALNSIDWQNWLYDPGMPKNKPVYDLTLYNQCEDLRKRWWEGTNIPTTAKEFTDFSVSQKSEFLSQLLINSSMPVTRILNMGTLYELSANKNAELAYRWYLICLKGRTENQLDQTLQFVTDHGRLEYIRPLYQEMYDYEAVRPKAITTFEANRPFMHPQTVTLVAKDLHLDE